MKIAYLKNFRKGLATNSSSTHSIIYRNDNELFEDLDIFETNFYGRFTRTIAASRAAKIKYVLADIMYNEPLVEIMSQYYPEMKQYFPLIKEAMETDNDDETFGMYYRGNLYFKDNLEVSIKYLRMIIDDPDIIIIGGSDESDFVYDKCENHVECPDPDSISYGKYHSVAPGVNKNGNYWFGYGDTYDSFNKSEAGYNPIKNSSFGRIRFATRNDQPLVPEYPELIDLKITNKCGNMCKFCFMGSNMDGSHADINHLKYIINQLGDTYDGTFHRVEFSIGGGDVLLYPQLDELFSFMRKNGHIINVTIKASDVMRLLDDDYKIETFRKYVSGIGVSVVDASDVDNIIALKGALTGKDVVAHLIPEYLGFDKTIEIVNRIDTASVYISKLYLGFKQMGRAKDMKYTVFRGDQLDKMFSGCRTVRVDTAFANRYMWYIKDNFSYKNTITLLEGEFSMYIDGVEEKAYKSSYHLDKPYNMRLDYHNPGDHMSIKQAFAAIRKDNGLLTYDELKDHYYDEPEKSN